MTPKFAFGDAVRVTGYGVEYRSKNCRHVVPVAGIYREKGVIIKATSDFEQLMVLLDSGRVVFVFESSLTLESDRKKNS